jgi:hypothetical protein
MEHQELRKHLQHIQDEIQNAQSTDAEGSRMLSDLEQDIRAFLDNPDGKAEALHPSLVERLQGTLYHFEATHPGLTTAITRLLSSLSSAGI